ncbi:MAG: Xaa-Pro peptidase family protein [Armatimonadota bacterium]|nr:Xaa-Pro peptidase family protein [Armatimonadota bacterium]MDR7519853.1 Xaa-Pro peptidase family protein [Armatimonadota bacterium]MDR7549613.1 Xaa-Pro peptidase family protein [Armatimonadota bacterium]
MGPVLLHAARADALMAASELDALVATTYQNVYYASGFWSFSQPILRATQVYAVLPRGAPDRVAVAFPAGEADMAAEAPPQAATLIPFGIFYVERGAASPDGAGDARLLQLTLDTMPCPSPAAALAAALDAADVSAGRVGVDETAMAAEVLEQVRAQRPMITFVPAAGLWRAIRAVKTAEEIARLQRAARITEDAVEAALQAAAAGVTERAMAQVFEQAILAGGGRPLFTVIAFGSHAAYPNAQPGLRRLAPGDLIRFDVGCLYEGYCSDIARTAVFGVPSPRQVATYQALLDGEEAALAAIRAGVSAGAVFEAAVRRVRDSGLSHYRRHHVGHGVGLEIYDEPLLAPDQTAELEAGMVLEVETPYYEVGFGGLQVEDTVLVTDDGCRLLTGGDRSLRRVA